jgi:hypothetical protein
MYWKNMSQRNTSYSRWSWDVHTCAACYLIFSRGNTINECCCLTFRIRCLLFVIRALPVFVTNIYTRRTYPNTAFHGPTRIQFAGATHTNNLRPDGLFRYVFIPVAPTWSIGHPWNTLFHFSFLILGQSVGLLGWGISPSQGRYIHRTTQTQNKRRQTSKPWVGFESTIPVFERTKTFHA